MSEKVYTLTITLGGSVPEEDQQDQLLATLLKLITDYKAALGGSSLAVTSVEEV